MGYDVEATVQETCSLAGTTSAVCTATAAVSADKTKTSSSTVSTITGTRYRRFDVEITGGAEKTKNAVATCAKPGAAASLNSKTMAIWALAGVMGVASVLSL